jgi:hypothetical protein
MIYFSSCPYYSTFYLRVLETAAIAGFPEANYFPKEEMKETLFGTMGHII